jgi:hypothetical protein
MNFNSGFTKVIIFLFFKQKGGFIAYLCKTNNVCEI